MSGTVKYNKRSTSVREYFYSFIALLAEPELLNCFAFDELMLMKNEILASHSTLLNRPNGRCFSLQKKWYTPSFQQVDEFINII